MASSKPKLFVELTDPENNKIYTIIVTDREYERLQTDETFANFKLQEAKESKDLQYAQFISETDTEEPEGSETNVNGDGSIDESVRSPSEDSAFKWPHEAILLLLDENQKRKIDFNSGKISQKKLWLDISAELKSHGHNITGPQCLSKFSGMKKTYKKTKDHNNKSGNSAKHWPYLTLMDDLMGGKPSITPVAVCSSTGNKRNLSESCGSSSNNDVDNEANRKKAKSTPASHLIAAFEERLMKSEQNKERRFKEFMAFKAQKAEEANQYKKRALDLLEKLVKANNSF
ncbi:uncharacterized protein LOC123295095 [Chrysoperla carnea]|uniref:uncharacterized protein LOC123295095 n=1 Tax=Chrysoperla carnea TaxID=189513 RepID=UPI001D07DBE4|nr:uncharacterized protein LOC123295095 [Chrysoperla carnea]